MSGKRLPLPTEVMGRVFHRMTVIAVGRVKHVIAELFGSAVANAELSPRQALMDCLTAAPKAVAACIENKRGD